MVLSDPYPRESKPSLYLIKISVRLATPDETDARGVEIRAFMEMTGEQLQQAAAGRAGLANRGTPSFFASGSSARRLGRRASRPCPIKSLGTAAVDPGMTNSGSVRHACGRQ